MTTLWKNKNLLADLLMCFLLILGTGNSYAKPPELTKVRLMLDWKPGAEPAFLYLGQEKGFFKKNGIDIEIVHGQGSSYSVNMVDSKNVDFALCAGESALQGRSSEPSRLIKVLAVFYPNTPTSIYSLAAKNIKNPMDLYERKVGVMKGSSAYKQYLAFSEKESLDKNKIVEIASAGSIQEILSGDLDAMVHFSFQHPLQLRLKGYEVNEIMLKDYGIKVYGQGLITNDDILKKRKDLVKRVVKSITTSLKYSMEHSQEALDIFLKSFPEQDKEYSKAKLEWVNSFIKDGIQKGKPLGYQDEAGWRATQDYLMQAGLINNRIPLDDLYTNEFLIK